VKIADNVIDEKHKEKLITFFWTERFFHQNSSQQKILKFGK